jgi:hypothetical protein
VKNKSRSAVCELYIRCYATTRISERRAEGNHMNIENVGSKCSRGHAGGASDFQVLANIKQFVENFARKI